MVKADKTELGRVFWNIPAERQLGQPATIRQGLSGKEAGQRIKRYGANHTFKKLA